MPAKKINVHVRSSGISCDPDGGSALSKMKGDQLQWVGHGDSFTLSFKDFSTGKPLPWPFAEPEPHWPVSDTGPLTIEIGTRTYIKYTVSAASSTALDPIIIVDRT